MDPITRCLTFSAAGGSGSDLPGAWVLQYGTASSDTYAVLADSFYSDGNLGVFSKQYAAKIDTDGNILWSKQVTQNSASFTAGSYAMDSSDNTYIPLYMSNTVSGGYVGGVIKLNSSGNVSWSKFTSTTGGSNFFFTVNAAADTNGNVFSVGNTDRPGYRSGTLIKNNSASTTNFRLNFSNGTNYIYNNAVKILSTNDVIVLGQDSFTGDQYIIKVSNSGVKLWNKFTRDNAGTLSQPNQAAVDSSDNIYTIAYLGASGYIVKYNSSGTIQWSKKITQSIAGNLRLRGIHCDSSGNVLIIGINTTNSKPIYFFKLDSSGNLIWQTQFNCGASSSLNLGDRVNLLTDGNGFFYAAFDSNGGQTAGSYDTLVVKLPDDGSTSAGSADEFTYTSASCTVTNGGAYVPTASAQETTLSASDYADSTTVTTVNYSPILYEFL